MIFVADLRLDIGSHTVLADAWVAPGTMAVQEKPSHLKIIFDIVTIKIDADDAARRTVPNLDAPTFLRVFDAWNDPIVSGCWSRSRKETFLLLWCRGWDGDVPTTVQVSRPVRDSSGHQSSVCGSVSGKGGDDVRGTKGSGRMQGMRARRVALSLREM